jgi:hypothetical protein
MRSALYVQCCPFSRAFRHRARRCSSGTSKFDSNKHLLAIQLLLDCATGRNTTQPHETQIALKSLNYRYRLMLNDIARNGRQAVSVSAIVCWTDSRSRLRLERSGQYGSGFGLCPLLSAIFVCAQPPRQPCARGFECELRPSLSAKSFSLENEVATAGNRVGIAESGMSFDFTLPPFGFRSNRGLASARARLRALRARTLYLTAVSLRSTPPQGRAKARARGRVLWSHVSKTLAVLMRRSGPGCYNRFSKNRSGYGSSLNRGISTHPLDR